MQNFYEILECCQNDFDCNGHDLGIKFNTHFIPFFQSYRKDKELFYKQHPQVSLDGIDIYKLTDEQAFCIISYTGSISSWINRDIRNKKKLSICKESYAQYLDESLDKIPAYNEKDIFRMDSSDEYQIKWWEKKQSGNIIHIPFFLSSSKENWDEEPTESSWIVWKIKTLKSNSKARDISNVTNNIDEKEILFKRNSFFKVEKINISKRIIDLIEVE